MCEGGWKTTIYDMIANKIISKAEGTPNRGVGAKRYAHISCFFQKKSDEL